jgi:hypothetical protein
MKRAQRVMEDMELLIGKVSGILPKPSKTPLFTPFLNSFPCLGSEASLMVIRSFVGFNRVNP